jgi:putative serine protease PepD
VGRRLDTAPRSTLVRVNDTSPSSPAQDPAPPAGTGTVPPGHAGDRPGGYPSAPPGSGLPAGGSPAQTTDPWSRIDTPGGPPGPPPTRPGPVAPSPGAPRRRPVALVAGALIAMLVAGGVGGAVGYEAASSNDGGTSVLSPAPAASAPSPAGDAPAAAAPAGSYEQVAQTVRPSVVQLEGASGEGSGVVISADGLILTNAHVLEAGQAGQQQPPLGSPGTAPEGGAGGQGLTAVFQDGNRAPVQVVGTDPGADLAVVRAQGVSGLTPAALGSSAQLQVGQEVVAVGSPLGLSGTVTTGIVSALQRPVASGGAQSGQATVLDAIQTDAAINPGNSGGALVDMQGRVVGITSAIASLGRSSGGPSGSIGLGFAIPVDQAARIGNELVTQGFATRAVLGVGVTEGADGAVLGQIAPGGAAAAAGLAPGDVVTRVNDRLIQDADSLVAAIRSQPPGSPVTLTVSSPGGEPRQVPVTLGSERSG